MPPTSDVFHVPSRVLQLFPSFNKLAPVLSVTTVVAPRCPIPQPTKRDGVKSSKRVSLCVLLRMKKRARKKRGRRKYPTSDLVHTPNARVYQIDELMFNIMSRCGMASLVAISHANRDGRDRVREMFHSRLRALILPFLPTRTAQEIFFQRMHGTNSAICGSIPFFLYHPLLPLSQFPPRDLNILTPKGGGVAWMKTLEEVGQITSMMVVHVDRAFSSHVYSAIRYWTSNVSIESYDVRYTPDFPIRIPASLSLRAHPRAPFPLYYPVC